MNKEFDEFMKKEKAVQDWQNKIHEINMKIEEAAEKEINEAMNSYDMSIVEISVKELPGERVGYYDGVMVILNKHMNFPLCVTVGENAGNYSLGYELYYEWLEDQLQNNYTLTKYTPEQIFGTFKVKREVCTGIISKALEAIIAAINTSDSLNRKER